MWYPPGRRRRRSEGPFLFADARRRPRASIVWLYPSGSPPQLIPGRSQGLLAEGVLTSANLVGPLSGFSLDDLVEELRSGGAYVNVHTDQFLGGEVRGQIR